MTAHHARRIAGLGLLLALLPAGRGAAQDSKIYLGSGVPPQLDAVYARGLAYLVSSQRADGAWGTKGKENATTGLALAAILARGDDPEFGRYAPTVRRGLDHLLGAMNPQSGFLGPSMYNHGFATLALAEAYGQVNDPRIGPALKQAVDLLLKSQSANGKGAWRYNTDSKDADTTVAGAQMVALMAARNAGIEIPDEAVDAALDFYASCQDKTGGIGYTGPGNGNSVRTAIGVLVFGLARQRDRATFKGAVRFLEGLSFADLAGYPFYTMYYRSQAHFQSNMDTWERWNAWVVDWLSAVQSPDGSWQGGNNGPEFSTATGLLAMALNFRYLPIYER